MVEPTPKNTCAELESVGSKAIRTTSAPSVAVTSAERIVSVVEAVSVSPWVSTTWRLIVWLPRPRTASCA